MRRLNTLTILLAICLLPAIALGQMTLLSEARGIDVSAEIYDDNTGDIYGYGDYSAAFGFDDYGDNLFADASDFFGYCDAEASQESYLGPGSFYFNGLAYTDAELFEDDFSAYANAGSYFEVEFSLATTEDWTLNGTIEGQAAAEVTISLTDEFGFPIYDAYWTNNSLPLLISGSGTLGPGTYTLSAYASSVTDVSQSGFYVASQSGYDLQFDVTGGTSSVGLDPARGLSLSAGPNPMQNETTIAFAGVSGRSVAIDVYDVRGRLVRRLNHDGGASGQVAWDGRDNAGQSVPQGMYFVRMQDGAEWLQRKVTVVR